MKRFKRVLVSVVVTIGMLMGGAVIAAPSANAGTVSQCVNKDAGYGYVFWTPSGSGRYAQFCYVDYDWIEEVFFGMHDGYRIMRVWN